MKLSKSQIIIICVGVVLVIGFAAVIFSGIGIRPEQKRVNLVIWGIDNDEDFAAAIKGFRDERPEVRIKYEKFPESTYEQKLIDALAAGNGPDIFMFRSDWIRKHMNKAVPAPTTIISTGRFSDLFPQVAVQDFISGSQIYASPLFIDTLALYYNKDVLDRRNVPLPPNTWDAFKNAVARGVTASFGGYAPLVARSGDIINALLMQANADLSLQNKSFVRISGTEGASALELYTSIKPPTVETYTGFANGTIGMILDYESLKPTLEKLNPTPNFAIAPLPQFNVNSPVVPARYYGFAVSNKSLEQQTSWQFIVYATTNPSIAESYLKSSGRPPALRNLIENYINDPALGVFASQALTARSWNMPASEGVFAVFNEMIKSVIDDKVSISRALSEAGTDINSLLR
ncbi:MAG: extracellular solute-binding protein [Parcubacteria group bacterium]